MQTFVLLCTCPVISLALLLSKGDILDIRNGFKCNLTEVVACRQAEQTILVQVPGRQMYSFKSTVSTNVTEFHQHFKLVVYYYLEAHLRLEVNAFVQVHAFLPGRHLPLAFSLPSRASNFKCECADFVLTCTVMVLDYVAVGLKFGKRNNFSNIMTFDGHQTDTSLVRFNFLIQHWTMMRILHFELNVEYKFSSLAQHFQLPYYEAFHPPAVQSSNITCDKFHQRATLVWTIDQRIQMTRMKFDFNVAIFNYITLDLFEQYDKSGTYSMRLHVPNDNACKTFSNSTISMRISKYKSLKPSLWSMPSSLLIT